MPAIPSPVDGISLRYDGSGSGPGAGAPARFGALPCDLARTGLPRAPLGRAHGDPDRPARARHVGSTAREVLIHPGDLRRRSARRPRRRRDRAGRADGLLTRGTDRAEHRALPSRTGQRLVSLGGSASAQRGAVDSVFFPGVIDAVRAQGWRRSALGQGLGRRGRAPTCPRHPHRVPRRRSSGGRGAAGGHGSRPPGSRTRTSPDAPFRPCGWRGPRTIPVWRSRSRPLR